MIGVVSRPEERAVVEEFFQLFKTPWEFFDPRRRHYEVLIVTDHLVPVTDASLIVVYGTDQGCPGGFGGVVEAVGDAHVFVETDGIRVPIYGRLMTFARSDGAFLFESRSAAPAGYETVEGGRRTLRIGYGLFQEVSILLTRGQPARNASIPALDLHIAMLRKWIVTSGIALMEIPPIPAGFRFIAFLTHDVDFLGIKRHLFDHSMCGFLYRATLGSLIDFLKGRISLRRLSKNLKAALALPFVFLGVCRDPWDQFEYCLEMEKAFRSTFFFIPFKNKAGKGVSGGKVKRRATKYDIEDAGAIVCRLQAKGCEVGVHGIDAWHNIEDAEKELVRIKRKTDTGNGVGIRVHWLCCNEQSFKVLDEAGYAYDTTMGYNETIGFKAGTAQVFRPIAAKRLLEIPLHVQDTALFGHGRMNVSEACAAALCARIIEAVCSAGGVLTVLWHERSLGPERLWDEFYRNLVNRMEQENAWFATGREIVEWFQLRRSARFEEVESDNGRFRITSDPARNDRLPPLLLRFHEGEAAHSEGRQGGRRMDHEDMVLPNSFTCDVRRPDQTSGKSFSWVHPIEQP